MRTNRNWPSLDFWMEQPKLKIDGNWHYEVNGAIS